MNFKKIFLATLFLSINIYAETNSIVAVLNNKPLTSKMLENYTKLSPLNKEQNIKKMIEDYLIQLFVDKNNLSPSKSLINLNIQKFASSNNISIEEFVALNEFPNIKFSIEKKIYREIAKEILSKKKSETLDKNKSGIVKKSIDEKLDFWLKEQFENSYIEIYK